MPPGAVEHGPGFNSLAAAVSYLDGLGVGQAVDHRAQHDQDEAFILNRDNVGKAVLEKVFLSSTIRRVEHVSACSICAVTSVCGCHKNIAMV